MYYEYARWYDPTVGRFVSPDPKKGRLSNPQTLNLYIYAVDQPTGIIDPSGEDGCWVFSWVCNQVSSGATTLYDGAVTAGNDLENECNNDPQFRAAVILTVATVAIVATAGLAAPALLPTIAVGIGLGASFSTVAHVGTTLARGGKITASGLFLAVSTGTFLGAVGAIAAPVGGTIATSLEYEASSNMAKLFTAGILASASVDVGLAKGETDPRQLATEGGLGALTAGLAGGALSEGGIETTGMTTLKQADIFAPGIAAFGRLSPNASAVLANAVLGDAIDAASGVGLGFLLPQ